MRERRGKGGCGEHGWCAGDGPWHAEPDEDGIPALTLGDGGTGVNRQLPHLGNGGTGVNRQLPEGDRLAWLNEWFRELQEGMGEARVCCGDWSRIMSPGTMTRNGPAAVLLDRAQTTGSASGFRLTASDPNWRRKCR